MSTITAGWGMPLRKFWICSSIFVAWGWSGIGAHAADAAPHPEQQPLTALPITARIKVPEGPARLETGFGSLWMANTNSKEVLRIDPDTNKVIATIRVGSKPDLSIGMGLEYVWIADTKDKTVKQIDPKTNQVVRTIAVNLPRETEGSIGVGEGSLWVLTNEGDTDSGTLSRIDPITGEISANIQVNAASHAALVAFGSVWVTSTAAGSVLRVDARNNTVTAEIPVHTAPRFLAADEGSVWVVSQKDGSLARIDPLTNKVAATINVGVPGEGGDLAIGENYVWVAADGVPLSQIDPRTNRLMRQFAGGKRDDTLRVGFGSAWIVDQLHGEIWRVDLPRLEGLPSL
jgi:virginiamycin B lyase